MIMPLKLGTTNFLLRHWVSLKLEIEVFLERRSIGISLVERRIGIPTRGVKV